MFWFSEYFLIGGWSSDWQIAKEFFFKESQFRLDVMGNTGWVPSLIGHLSTRPFNHLCQHICHSKLVFPRVFSCVDLADFPSVFFWFCHGNPEVQIIWRGQSISIDHIQLSSLFSVEFRAAPHPFGRFGSAITTKICILGHFVKRWSWECCVWYYWEGALLNQDQIWILGKYFWVKPGTGNTKRITKFCLVSAIPLEDQLAPIYSSTLLR